MAVIIKDRVQESTATTGTGALALGGAPLGFLTYGSVMSVGDTCRYCIVDPVANAWEVGNGTYSATNTLTRTTVEASSNAGAAVNLAGSAGTYVFLTVSAAQIAGLIAPSMQVGTYTDATVSINVNDDIAVLNRATDIVATLGAGTKDGHEMLIVRQSASNGSHTVTGDFNLEVGVSLGSFNSPRGGESYTVKWSAGQGFWFRKDFDPGFKVADLPTGTTPTGAELVAGYQSGTDAQFTFNQIAALNPSGFQTAAQVASAVAAGTAANVSGTVAVAHGGTGATDAASARSNLGLPANFGDYVINVTQPGVTANAQRLLVHALPHAITLPASLTGSSAVALVAATASTAFTLAYMRAGSTTTIATFTFAAAGTAATISGVTIPTLLANDVLILTGPATADATLADFGFSILGTKV